MSVTRLPRLPTLQRAQERDPLRPLLRQLLPTLLPTDTDFEAFCTDYFPSVHQKFTNTMDRDQKLHVLLMHSEAETILETLRTHFQENPGALATIQNYQEAPTSEAARRAREQLVEIEQLYIQREELRQQNLNTAKLDEEIRSIKRAMRGPTGLADGALLNERYKLIECIGHGGFGKVWKAFDLTERQYVAVKILRRTHGDNPHRIQRFLRGARTMHRLKHPNIVRVLDGPTEYGEDFYFVMDYCAGGDLGHAITTGKLDQVTALRAIGQIASALDYAHEQNLVHRDVKPQNILLDGKADAQLTDFDLVWAPDTTGGTEPDDHMGTPFYEAPEQHADASQADPRVDVFSLGMVILFALDGRPMNRNRATDRRTLIDKLDCAAGVKNVLRKATADEPTERFRSAGELVTALHQALSRRGTVASRPWLWGSVGTFLLTAMGGATVHVASSPRTLAWQRLVAQHFPKFNVPQDEAVRRHLTRLNDLAKRLEWSAVRDEVRAIRQQYGATLLDDQMRTLKELEDLSESEQKIQKIFEQLKAASQGSPTDDDLKLFGKIPPKSVYARLAERPHQELVGRYLTARVEEAGKLRTAGQCSKYQALRSAIQQAFPSESASRHELNQNCPPVDTKGPELASTMKTPPGPLSIDLPRCPRSSEPSEAMKRVLLRPVEDIYRCYPSEAVMPRKIEVALSVRPSGIPLRVEQLDPSDKKSCIMRLLLGLRFPRCQGASFYVIKDVLFSPNEH